MRKWLLLAAFIIATQAFGQGARFDGVTTGPSGRPAAGVTVAICTQPATTSTTPCSPLATLYTDTTLATPCNGSNGCSNPITSDGLGNYHFYYNPGPPYTFQFYGQNLTPYFIPDQLIQSQAENTCTNVLTVEGELLTYHNGSCSPITIGTTSYVLTSNGTDAIWAPNAAGGSVCSGILLDDMYCATPQASLSPNAVSLIQAAANGAVQAGTGSNFLPSPTGVSVPFTGPVTAGDNIIVLVDEMTGGLLPNNTFAISDSQGNTYTNIANQQAGTSHAVCFKATAASTGPVTVNALYTATGGSGANSFSVIIEEFQNIGSYEQLVFNSTNVGPSQTLTTTMTTTHANDTIISVLGGVSANHGYANFLVSGEWNNVPASTFLSQGSSSNVFAAGSYVLSAASQQTYSNTFTALDLTGDAAATSIFFFIFQNTIVSNTTGAMIPRLEPPWGQLTSLYFANLPTQNGFWGWCPDCDTPSTQGATCSASGDHAGATYGTGKGVAGCYDPNVGGGGGGGATFQVNGTNTSTQTTINFINGTYLTATNPSVGQVKFDLTGTVPITLGGTGQTTASAAFTALSPLTTEGDLLYFHSSNNARLGIGGNGTCLTSNGTDPSWGSCASGSGITTETNGVSNSSQASLNLINSAATNGVTLTQTNTTAGTVQLGITGTLGLGGGGTGQTSFGAGLLRSSGSALSSAELSGDCTTSGSNAITCLKTNGVAFTPLATTAITGYSVLGSGASTGAWITPTGNGQCLMSAASSYATTTPSFQTCNFGFGTMAQYQTLVATSPSTTQGVGPGTTGFPFVSGGASAYPSFAALTASGLASQAVTSAKMTTELTYRTCDIYINGVSTGTAIVTAQLGPEVDQCYVAQAATIVEMDVRADAGTSSIIIGRNHAGTISNIVSAALATHSAGARSCSNTGGTTGLDGVTTCSGTLQNTTLARGDSIQEVSGTADGTAKAFSVHVIYATTN